MSSFLPRTIRARFLLGSVLSIAAALAVVGLAVPTIARDHEIDVLGGRLASDANIARDLARDLFRAADADGLDALAHRVASDAQIRVTLGDGRFESASAGIEARGVHPFALQGWPKLGSTSGRSKRRPSIATSASLSTS